MATNPPTVPSLDAVESAFAGAYTALSLIPRQGGQGLACRARSSDGTYVALKIYKLTHIEARVDREVAALRELRNEHLVQFHGTGRIEVGGEGYRFIATTWVNGTPLATIIDNSPMALPSAARVVSDVANAIEALWTSMQRIVHRDIKPDNIIVSSDGRGILIDLGIARHLAAQALTTAGHTYGTKGYYAPEHITGRPVSWKADIFALGIVFQEMLLGRHPTGRIQDLLLDGGPKVAKLGLNVPSFIGHLIDRMVTKKSFDRPDARNVQAVLNTYLKNLEGGK